MAEIPDYKILKKLADSCRKAGIKSFKGFGMEFTLSDDLPVSTYKQSKMTKVESSSTVLGDDGIETDSLSEDALMMWSGNLANDVFRGAK